MIAFTSISNIAIPNVYASETINTVQHVTNDDMYNTLFTVEVTDLDGNLISPQQRVLPVVAGLVGAVQYLFGTNAVYTVSGLVYTIYKSGVITNTVTFVKGAAANGGIMYTAQVADRIYKFIVK